MDDDAPDSSLSSLWSKAEEARLSIETTGNALDPTYCEALQQVISQHTILQSHISSLSLFSPNESLEDLTTESLRYMLCPAHLASLTMRTPASSPRERKEVLGQARSHYEAFLSLLGAYGLLRDEPYVAGAPSHRKLLRIYQESPTGFSVAGASGGDPNAKRNAKLANYRAEKELKERLQYLRGHPAYVAGVAGTGPTDEDMVRKVYLAQTEMAAHEAFHALEGVNMEMQILAMAPDPDARHAGTRAAERGGQEDERSRRRIGGGGGLGDMEAGFSERLDQPLRDFSAANKAPLLSTSGKPLRPFTLVGSRQDIAKGVFRPGHNLPTMGIDEYLEEEKRRGGIIEGGGEASYARPEPDEDDMEKADEETYKARAWDEFTEANPKGAGNTLNRG
ncbi:uncharacterized protein MKZ38_003597 [Zalerion maritima]|uniref:TAP42-like protein n=1 Tax=Zalerion maritima TaxID=339359 RepID=A0AAD5RMR3_9PEZI|nr:uncharacterized protein MKZ38_003597 [Zalerion maritima]